MHVRKIAIAIISISLFVMLASFFILRSYLHSKYRGDIKNDKQRVERAISMVTFRSRYEEIQSFKSFTASMARLLKAKGIIIKDIYSTEELEKVYDDAIYLLTKYRDTLINHKQLSDAEKNSRITKVIKFYDYEMEVVLRHRENDRVIRTLFDTWTKIHRDKLMIRKSDLFVSREPEQIASRIPEEQPEDESTTESSVSDLPESSYEQPSRIRKVVKESRKIIRFENLQNYIGKKLEFQLQNGKSFIGIVKDVKGSEVQITQKFPGGNLSFRLLQEQITEIAEKKVDIRYEVIE